jgi:hypothetical protein
MINCRMFQYGACGTADRPGETISAGGPEAVNYYPNQISRDTEY